MPYSLKIQLAKLLEVRWEEDTRLSPPVPEGLPAAELKAFCHFMGLQHYPYFLLSQVVNFLVLGRGESNYFEVNMFEEESDPSQEEDPESDSEST